MLITDEWLVTFYFNHQSSSLEYLWLFSLFISSYLELKFYKIFSQLFWRDYRHRFLLNIYNLNLFLIELNYFLKFFNIKILYFCFLLCMLPLFITKYVYNFSLWFILLVFDILMNIKFWNLRILVFIVYLLMFWLLKTMKSKTKCIEIIWFQSDFSIAIEDRDCYSHFLSPNAGDKWVSILCGLRFVAVV